MTLDSKGRGRIATKPQILRAFRYIQNKALSMQTKTFGGQLDVGEHVPNTFRHFKSILTDLVAIHYQIIAPKKTHSGRFSTTFQIFKFSAKKALLEHHIDCIIKMKPFLCKPKHLGVNLMSGNTLRILSDTLKAFSVI